MNWWDNVDWQDPINRDCPLNAGILGWWMGAPGLFGGTRLWDLCNRNHGTLTNMDPATDWVNSQYGTALSFSGTKSCQLFPRLSVLIPNPLTTTFTTFTAFRSDAKNQNIFGLLRNGAGPDSQYRVIRTSGNTIECVIGGESVSPSILATSTTISDGEWHTVQWVKRSHNPASWSLLRDGISDVGTSSFSGDDSTWEDVNNCSYSLGGINTSGGFTGIVQCHIILLGDISWPIHDQWRRGFPDMLNRWRRKSYFIPAADAGNILTPYYYQTLLAGAA